MTGKFSVTFAFVSLAFAASAAAPWSDTPVTCHWIGEVKAGSTSGRDYASWTNADNWAEGIVPGMSIVNGVTNGCFGCTAVFDRPCKYTAVDFIYGQTMAISNIVVTGSTVPQITLGRPWDHADPHLFLENGGGIHVDADVVDAPVMRAAIKYILGNAPHKLYFENNSSSPFTMRGFQGVATKFPSWTTMWLVMRGTGDIRQVSSFVNTGGGVKINLEMNGGKYVQEADGTIYYIDATTTDIPQHLEIANGVTLTVSDVSVPLNTKADLLVDGGGTMYFNGDATKAASIGVKTGATLTFDCDVTRKAGGSFQVGHNNVNGGTIVLAPGRSFGGVPISFNNNTVLQLPSNETFTSAITIPSGQSGTIAGGTDGEAKIAGGVAGTTRPLTLKGRLAIASDVTATTTLSADAALSFRNADGAATTAFTISSLKIMGDATIPVEDGVTATITAIDNNGHTLDIMPEGTGKVVFSGLSAGFAPAWLRINGRRGVVSAGGELVAQSAVADDTAIDAHGGVVPNSAASVVAVTTANGPAAENVTLAENATSVLMLRQRQSVDDVLIEMSAGQTLSAGAVSVLAGAKSLTVGSSAGVGALAPNGDALELDVADASSTMTVNADVAIPAGKRLVKEGAGEVVFNGIATGLVEFNGGSLSFANGESEVELASSNSMLSVAGSTAPGSRFDLTLVGGAVELSGRLDDAYFVAASNGVGRIEITDGCVTGGLICAANSSSLGTFRIRGGEFVNPSTGNYAGEGYAYTKIDGGICRMTDSNHHVMPAHGHNGVFEQTGGKFRRDGGFRVGSSNDALGLVCVKGGEFRCVGGDVVMPSYNGNAGGILTVEGDATVELDSTKLIHLACVNNDQNGGKWYGNASMVNLNGGKLIAKAVARCATYSNIAERAYLNFNGGTFKPANYIQPFGSVNVGAWEYRLDRVTSFEKGATVEISDSGYTYVPIQAPYGKGLESIAWSPVSGLPGAPVVVIEDPDGTGAGASAFVDVDDYGTITNVHVTSPGWNYTRATAKLYTKNGNLVATFDCTLKDQKSGGLTKTGNGRLDLRCQNTYTGATVLKQGTLKIECNDAIDSRSALVLAGGTLDLNNCSQKFSSVSGTSGSVVNGTLGLTGLVVDLAEVAAGRYPTVSAPVAFDNGAEVTLENVSALAERRGVTLANFTGGVSGDISLSAESAAALPDGADEWKLSTIGTRLRLVRNSGIMIIVF